MTTHHFDGCQCPRLIMVVVSVLLLQSEVCGHFRRHHLGHHIVVGIICRIDMRHSGMVIQMPWYKIFNIVVSCTFNGLYYRMVTGLCHISMDGY